MNRRRLVILAVLTGLAYASVSGGCLRKWRAKREAARQERIAQQEAEAAGLAPGLGETPEDGSQVLPTVGLTVQGDPGLEVAVWTCDDTGFAAARVLEPFVNRPVPIAQSEIDAWRARGVRFVAVPVAEIDRIASASRPMTPVQRQRFGQLTDWSAVVRGPSVPPGARGPSGPIPPGKPRLIARAWLEPDLTAGELREVVRIEAGLQMERRDLNASWLGEEPGLRSIGREGEIVGDLLVSFVAGGSDAIVLVGESPDVDWSELPDMLQPTGAPDSGPAGPNGTVTEPVGDTETDAVPTRAGTTSLGPRPPTARTVGERMLTAPGVAPRDGRPGMPARKVFVVLIPRVPGALPPESAVQP